MKLYRATWTLCFAFVLLTTAPFSARAAWQQPAKSDHAMVTSANPHATAAGHMILSAGGNVVDAAVAVSFALSVAEPWSSGIGGGGFMVVHIDGATLSWDFRETAPAAATRDMYVKDGAVVKGESTWSARAAGIPGQVRGLAAVHRAHGRLPFAAVVAPAVVLARSGFAVTPLFQARTVRATKNMDARARAIFLSPEGLPWPQGTLFKQPALARTLTRIAETEGEAFYTGDIAKALVEGVREAGGIWTLSDLANYKVKRRSVVRGTYRGYKVASMGPPSSGGLLLIQMLSVLESFDLASAGYGAGDGVHVLAEVMKRAYAMRAKGLGDPDFFNVDWDRFTGSETIERIRREVSLAKRATPSSAIGEVTVRPTEKTHTSHFAVMMANGDAVACTQTINLTFGNGRMAGDTGVVLNNEMDDFSALPGAPNAFGLVGDEANAIAPLKRPLSSMTPTLVLKDGKAVGAFGSPGGSRIITTTLQSILNVIDHKMNVSEAIGAPRIHHQWYPEALMIEADALRPETRAMVESKGHTLKEVSPMGNAMAIWRGEDGVISGAADPRGEGTARGLIAP